MRVSRPRPRPRQPRRRWSCSDEVDDDSRFVSWARFLLSLLYPLFFLSFFKLVDLLVESKSRSLCIPRMFCLLASNETGNTAFTARGRSATNKYLYHTDKRESSCAHETHVTIVVDAHPPTRSSSPIDWD